MTVAIYARQSVDHGEGIDRQIARCKALADSRGWTVGGEFVDNATSATKGRGPGTRWADLLEAPEVIVIAVDLDRLVRSQKDLLALVEAGKRIVTVDGEIDLSSADGEFRASMLAAIARFEVRRKGERQLRANESRVAKGLPVPGKRRYGFNSGNITEHPEEGPDVRRIFADFIGGASIRSLAIARDMRPVRIREMLANPAYAGWVVRHGERFDAHESVARLVTRGDFATVQALLTAPGRKTSPGAARRYLMSGIARCGVCGAGLSSTSGGYRCSEASDHVFMASRDAMDYKVVRRVFARLGHPSIFTALRVPEADPDARARLTKALEDRQRLTGLLLDGDLDAGVIRDRLKAVNATIREEEEALAAVGAQTVEARLVETAVHRAGMLGEAWFELTLDEQRSIVRRLFTVTLHKGRGTKRIDIKAR